MNLVEYYKKILSEAYSGRANRIEMSVGKQETQLFDKYGIKSIYNTRGFTSRLTPEEHKKYTGKLKALDVAQAGLNMRNRRIALELKDKNPKLFDDFTSQALKILAPMMDYYRDHPDMMAPLVHSEVGRIYSTHAQEVNNPNSDLNNPMNLEGRRARSQLGPILHLLKKKK